MIGLIFKTLIITRRIIVYESSHLEKVLKLFYMGKTHSMTSSIIVQSINLKKDSFRPVKYGKKGSGS